LDYTSPPAHACTIPRLHAGFGWAKGFITKGSFSMEVEWSFE